MSRRRPWMNAQIRPTVAKWLQDLSLGTRLSFLIGLIVFGVVTSVSYLEVRSYEDHIDSDLVDTARLAARSAADELAERPLAARPPRHSRFAARFDRSRSGGRLRSRSSRPARPASRACSRARQPKNATELLDLAGRAIATKALTSLRKQRAGDVRVAGAATRTATPWRSPSAWRASPRRAPTNFGSPSGSPFRPSCS